MRRKIANWLTGGELRRLQLRYEAAADQLRQRNEDYFDAVTISMARQEALRMIAAEAKRGKNPNATVRRMGKWAEEAVNAMGDGL